MVSALTRQTGQLLSQKARKQWRWRARTVKLVDGTGLSMPDAPENQAAYPQPRLDTAIGPHQGKGSGELGLVRRLLDGFNPGDVVLADALYCNFEACA